MFRPCLGQTEPQAQSRPGLLEPERTGYIEAGGPHASESREGTRHQTPASGHLGRGEGTGRRRAGRANLEASVWTRASSCRKLTISFRVHSCPFVVPTHPFVSIRGSELSFRAIRVHSWFHYRPGRHIQGRMPFEHLGVNSPPYCFGHS